MTYDWQLKTHKLSENNYLLDGMLRLKRKGHHLATPQRLSTPLRKKPFENIVGEKEKMLVKN